MIRGIVTVLSFFSAIFFPWQLTVGLVLGAVFFESWVPLAVGLFIDTLYYAPHVARVPFFTLAGALVTGIAFFVQSRLKTSSIKE